MSALFNHAMRYEWTERHPIKLVRQSAKRERVPEVLTAEEIPAVATGRALLCHGLSRRCHGFAGE